MQCNAQQKGGKEARHWEGKVGVGSALWRSSTIRGTILRVPIINKDYCIHRSGSCPLGYFRECQA